MAAGATRASAGDATRSFDTAEGRLSHAELAERLAAPIQAVDLSIRRGEHAAAGLDEGLLLRLHAGLTGALFPADAGRYRRTQVQISAHEPPVAALVPQRMRDYFGNLAERLRHLSGEGDDLLLEFLAYAEGELLTIHPFSDLNGRMSRLWLTEILRRLELPPVDVVPAGPAFRARYLAALSAADNRDWRPLTTLWKERLSQPAGLNEIELPGCNPTPLASYLKALAVLRLVAEAGDEGGGDAQATGFWRNDMFVLRTRLTPEQVVEFFLSSYRPTPLVAPWNGGSGFYPNDNKAAIDGLAKTSAARFQDYRDAIVLSRSTVARCALGESPKQASKDSFLRTLRNLASDPLVRWMDAAAILSESGSRYPPLLGTGGNDGRLDFTNNFMQRLADVIDVSHGEPRGGAMDRLHAALFGSATNLLTDAAIGQFAPGSAGGPNAGSGFEGDARVNAWDFILMLEGAVLFAASMARKLESTDAAILVAPFTVRSRSGTSGSAGAVDDESARGEIWMPLWTAPSTLAELSALLGEGRAAVDARPSRDGLDFARAVSQLGVDRGIASFQRFGFLMRSGKAFLATPLNRIAVRRSPDADLITDLERNNWLGAVQRHARDDTAPNALRSAARQLDAALFALTQRAGRGALQALLRHVGRIEAALGTSIKSHDQVRLPAPRLSAAWAIKADDGSNEFRIASALAGMTCRDAEGRDVLHARRHLVAVSEVKNREGDRAWEPTSRVAVWGVGSLANNLTALLHRRRLEAIGHGSEGELLASGCGATRQAVADFLDHRTDDTRIAELLGGLACVNLRGLDVPRGDPVACLPATFAILKILFTPESVLRALRWLPEDRSVRLPAEVPARLAANDVPAAMQIVWRRLRALGVDLPGRDPPKVIGADGPRWLAALCIPLTFAETAHLLRDLPFSSPTERLAEAAAVADGDADTPN